MLAMSDTAIVLVNACWASFGITLIATFIWAIRDPDESRKAIRFREKTKRIEIAS